MLRWSYKVCADGCGWLSLEPEKEELVTENILSGCASSETVCYLLCWFSQAATEKLADVLREQNDFSNETELISVFPCNSYLITFISFI